MPDRNIDIKGNISGRVVIVNGDRNSIIIQQNGKAIIKRNASFSAPVSQSFPDQDFDAPELRHLIGHQAEIEKLTELYLQAYEAKRGAIVFINSKPGYGAKALGRTFIDAIRKSEVNTAVTRFWEQNIDVRILKDTRWASLLEKYQDYFETCPPYLRTDTYLPFLPIFTQLVAGKYSNFDDYPLPANPNQIPSFLRKMVSPGKPLVILLEDFENADYEWVKLLRFLEPEINRDLGIFFVVALHSNESLIQIDPDRLLPCQEFALEFLRRDKAKVISLGRVNEEDIAAYISPADISLVKKLMELSAGIPLLVENLWQIWKKQGDVRKSISGIWELKSKSRWSGKYTGRDFVEDIFDEQWYSNEAEAPWSRERMLEMLTYAAQEGNTFTLEALAYAFQVDENVLEEELLGFLDEPDDPGLVTVIEPPEKVYLSKDRPFKVLHHFQFQPIIVWEALINYSELSPERLVRYAEGLKSLYLPSLRIAANRISYFYQRAGKNNEARLFRRILHFTNPFDPLLSQVEIMLMPPNNDSKDLILLDLFTDLWSKRYVYSNPQIAEKLFQQALEIALYKRNETFCCQINYWLGEAVYIQGRCEEAITFFSSSLELSEKLGDQKGVVACRNRLGLIDFQQGKHEQAEQNYKKALKIGESNGYKQGIAVCRNGIGNVEFQRGNFEQAERNYKITLEICESLGDQQGIAACRNGIGNVAYMRGNYEQAEQDYKLALEISESIGDQHGLATCLNGLGMVASQRGRYEQAEQFIKKALEISESIGDQQNIKIYLYDLGRVTLRQGRYEEAVKFLNKALEMSESIGDQQNIAVCSNELGFLSYKQGMHEQAELFHKKACDIFKSIGDQRGISISLHGLGNVAIQLGRYEQAEQNYKSALEISESIGDQQGIGASRSGLGNVAIHLGRYEQAEENYKLALVIEERLANQVEVSFCLNGLGLVAFKQGRYEQAEQSFKKALQISMEIGNQETIEVSTRFLKQLDSANIENEEKKLIDLQMEESKMSENRNQPNITVDGNITNGNIILGSNNIISNVSDSTNVAVGNEGIVNQSSIPDDVTVAFSAIGKIITEMPEGSNKLVAEQAVKELEVEARKGENEKVNKSNVEKWLLFLAETAGDAWKVALDTLSNPILGLNTAFRLIIAKAKVEREKKK